MPIYSFEPSKSAKIHKNENSEPSICVKLADFAIQKSPNLISRKMRNRKIMKFSHCAKVTELDFT